MPRDINLIGGFYEAKSLPFSAQDTVNWLPVPAQVQGSRSPIKLRGLPGLNALNEAIETITITGNAPDTTQNTAGYSFTYTVVGGVGPYLFSISSGSLPTGLTFNTATGTISGTPTIAETQAFIVTVEDANGLTDSVTDSITVAAAAVNTLALLRFDGTNGSTIITDDTGLRSWTVGGTGQLTTANFYSGTASLDCGNRTGWVQAPDSNDWDLNVWCFEAWIYPTAYDSAFGGIFSRRNAAVFAPFEIQLNGVGIPTVLIGNASFTAWAFNNAFPGSTPPLNQWSHLAVYSDGSNVRLALNGIVSASAPPAVPIQPGNFPMYVGQGGDAIFRGQIDLARISKVARYGAANFTPPTNYVLD